MKQFYHSHATVRRQFAFRTRFGTIALLVVIMLVLPQFAKSAAVSPTILGTAQSFLVLGGSAVTNTGPTTLNSGNLGVSPGTAITGFPPGIVVSPGTIHANDAVAAQAQSDVNTAYNTLAGLARTATLTGQDLGGKTLLQGVYFFATSAQLTGQLTLDAQGDPNAVFVFQIGSTLTTASNSSVLVINGASPCNVYWQVGSSATLGPATRFVGNILALTSIALNTGATVSGRALAHNGAVTLDTNTFSSSGCVSNITPTTMPTTTETPTITTPVITTPTTTTPVITTPTITTPVITTPVITTPVITTPVVTTPVVTTPVITTPVITTPATTTPATTTPATTTGTPTVTTPTTTMVTTTRTPTITTPTTTRIPTATTRPTTTEVPATTTRIPTTTMVTTTGTPTPVTTTETPTITTPVTTTETPTITTPTTTMATTTETLTITVQGITTPVTTMATTTGTPITTIQAAPTLNTPIETSTTPSSSSTVSRPSLPYTGGGGLATRLAIFSVAVNEHRTTDFLWLVIVALVSLCITSFLLIIRARRAD